MLALPLAVPALCPQASPEAAPSPALTHRAGHIQLMTWHLLGLPSLGLGTMVTWQEQKPQMRLADARGWDMGDPNGYCPSHSGCLPSPLPPPQLMDAVMLQLTRARNRLTTPATLTLPEIAASGLTVSTSEAPYPKKEVGWVFSLNPAPQYVNPVYSQWFPT